MKVKSFFKYLALLLFLFSGAQEFYAQTQGRLGSAIRTFNNACVAPNNNGHWRVNFRWSPPYPNPDNKFYIELSDANGDFNNPTVLKVINTKANQYIYEGEKGKTNPELDFSLPTNLNGSNFKIRVRSTNPAFEKAGIIKNGEICIFSQNLSELENEINKKTKKSINVLKKYKNIDIELDKKNFTTTIKFENDKKIKKFELPLFGKFQGNNFLLSYEIAKRFGISDKDIQNGINHLKLFGRFEIFSKNPFVILDVAHNEDSMKVLFENLSFLYKKNEVIFITSMLKTKDFVPIFEKIQEFSDKIFITSLKDVTYGMSSHEIKKEIEKFENKGKFFEKIVFEDDILAAYKKAKKLEKYKAIVICGSFYEIAKFKKLFENKN